MKQLDPFKDWCRIVECEQTIVLLMRFHDVKADEYTMKTVYHMHPTPGAKEVEEVVLITPVDEEDYTEQTWEYFCSVDAVTRRLKTSSKDILKYHNSIH